MDNIFFSEFCSGIVSSNITVGISDHMPQIALMPDNTTKKDTFKALPQKSYQKI